jgi:hypothetical protein
VEEGILVKQNLPEVIKYFKKSIHRSDWGIDDYIRALKMWLNKISCGWNFY